MSDSATDFKKFERATDLLVRNAAIKTIETDGPGEVGANGDTTGHPF